MQGQTDACQRALQWEDTSTLLLAHCLASQPARCLWLQHQLLRWPADPCTWALRSCQGTAPHTAAGAALVIYTSFTDLRLYLFVLCCCCCQTLERIPKMSANWYAEVVKKNRLDMM
jgi:hypothetical protein